jgi:hypothetical protein
MQDLDVEQDEYRKSVELAEVALASIVSTIPD